jgi:hypothetical protein
MPDSIPTQGVIIRAENGDVIRYDETGLVLRLSDKVIADIAARLELKPQTTVAPQDEALPDLLEGVDLWAPRRIGDWLHFQANLPGADSARGYRRHIDGGAILAEAQGPLLGILGLGGARAGLGSPGPARFRYHVLGPADDIGAVGMGAEGEAPETAGLEPLREVTVEAALADALLARRRAAFQPLPLFFARTETDTSPTASALGTGLAVANFDRALANLQAAATRLGTTAQVPAVVLDYTLEDLTGDSTAYRDGMIALMERITRAMAKLGLARPVFLATFDCGTHEVTRGPALDGQWELSWNHGDHQLVFAAPSYAFEIDDTGRLTDAGRLQKAEALADALLAFQSTNRWLCPTIQLAEAKGNDIRLICEAMDGLEIAKDDPFDAGKLAGFALEGVTNGATIKKVEIDKDDPKVAVLRLSKLAEGEVFVTYAHAATPGKGPYPANRGALRDAQGRWALPARLKLTGG